MHISSFPQYFQDFQQQNSSTHCYSAIRYNLLSIIHCALCLRFSISTIHNTICKISGGTTMSNIHKNPTISFRPTPYERKEIEARIKASGLPKKISIQGAVYTTASVSLIKKRQFSLQSMKLSYCTIDFWIWSKASSLSAAKILSQKMFLYSKMRLTNCRKIYLPC